MNERLTIKQLSNLAGVSTRTLRYYDEIELLKPADIGENGYRYYDDASLLRLQQILFYRELDFDLSQIKKILDDPQFDLVVALQIQRQGLQDKIARLTTLVQTLDTTIHHVVGEVNLSENRIFKGFSEEKQRQYEEEATEAWGESVKESIQLWNSYSKERQQEILDEGNAIYANIAERMADGPSSASVQALLVRWHQHIRYFYEPSIEVLEGLGQMYDEHPDFHANFADVHPDLPGFLKTAIAHYVDVLETEWLEKELGILEE